MRKSQTRRLIARRLEKIFGAEPVATQRKNGRRPECFLTGVN
jgi:hypothetical protein